MRKILLFALAAFFLGTPSLTEAQCYGTVNFDVAVNAQGASTYTITTSHCNELIMISYDGWPGPGNGPVTVNGNPATYINTAFVYYYAVAETYAYIAGSTGTYTISCSESPFGSPYYLNSAAGFYVTGSGYPISIGSLTNAQGTVSCVGGGSVSANIATSIPGSMIYDNFDCNNGQCCAFTDSWTGATFMNSWHEGNGIDQSEAYTIASTPTNYNVTANCSANPGPCGGLSLLLVVIPPPVCGGGGGGLTVTSTEVDPGCAASNGSISLTVSGGTSPYEYTWTPNVSTSDNATGLSAGTYSISINDASCHDTTIVATLSSLPLAITANALTNLHCYGNCIGSANSVITGGTSPYTYLWAPSGGTNATATGLCGGTYTVAVIDKNGCTGTATVAITQPNQLTATMGAPTNILCNGDNNGSAAVTAGGGNSPYSYSWTPSGGTTDAATALSAGKYTVTVTDSIGCTATASASITQPVILTTRITVASEVGCNGGNNGSLIANPSGGTSPYTYSWTGGGTKDTLTGLTAGTYTTTITDNNGCTATASATITQANQLTAIMSPPTNVLCNGDNNGKATVTVGGGNSPYTYSWSPAGGSSATAKGLSAGIYTVTINDFRGCLTTASVTITQPTILTMSPIVTAITCKGEKNGTALSNPTGGTTPYTYSWSGGGTTANASGMTTGSYTVTVTDNNGCSATASLTITEPAASLAATMSVQGKIKCYGENTGNATASASGGTSPYTYSWTSGGTGANATNLTAGTYTVIVKDSNGCSVTASARITQPSQLTATLSNPKSGLCNGASGGDTVIAQGGTPAYTYAWAPSGGSGYIAANLTSGTYTVTVTDKNGCSASSFASIVSDSVFISVCCNTTIVRGDDTIIVANGDSMKSFTWSPSVNCLNPPLCNSVKVTPTVTTTYTIIGTDYLGCQVESVVTINVDASCFNFTVPNVLTPDNAGTLGLDNIFYINTSTSYINSWSILIYNRWGKEVFKSTNPTQYWNGTTESGGQAPPGVYYYIIKATCQDNTYNKSGFVQLIR